MHVSRASDHQKGRCLECLTSVVHRVHDGLAQARSHRLGDRPRVAVHRLVDDQHAHCPDSTREPRGTITTGHGEEARTVAETLPSSARCTGPHA